TPSHTGRFWVMATTADTETTGAYELQVKAAQSGCVAPILIAQPPDREVPWGTQITLDTYVSVSIPGARWDWYDMYAAPVVISNADSLLTPPVTARQFYAVHIANSCGETTSRMFTITPAFTKRRAGR